MTIALKLPPISGDILLNEKPAFEAFNKVVNEAKATRDRVAPVLGDTGQSGGKAFLSGLKSQLGKGSTIAQFTKLAMGGGAVAGASLVVREFAELTRQAAEFANELRQGGINGLQMADRIASNIPVLGRVWDAGKNLREMVLGERAAVELLNEEARLTTKYFDDTLRAALNVKGAIADIRQETARLRQQVAQNNEPDPLVRKIMGLKDTAANDDAADLKKKAEQQASIRADNAKRIADLQAVLDNQRSQFKQNYSTPFEKAEMTQEWVNKRASQADDLISTISPQKAKELRNDFEALKGLEQQLLNLKWKGNEDLKKLDEEYAQATRERQTKLGQDIVQAQKDAAHEQLSEVEKQMAERRIREEDAADEELSRREQTLKEQMQVEQKQLRQLPSAGIGAAEIFGSHLVTSADVPPGYQEAQQSIKRTADNTERTAKAVEQMRDGRSSGGAALAVDVIASGAW